MRFIFQFQIGFNQLHCSPLSQPTERWERLHSLPFPWIFFSHLHPVKQKSVTIKIVLLNVTLRLSCCLPGCFSLYAKSWYMAFHASVPGEAYNQASLARGFSYAMLGVGRLGRGWQARCAGQPLDCLEFSSYTLPDILATALGCWLGLTL